MQWIGGQARDLVNGRENELASIPLVELRQANELMGEFEYYRDYRIAIRNRIEELQRIEHTKDQRTALLWITIGGAVIGSMVGSLISLVIQYVVPLG